MPFDSYEVGISFIAVLQEGKASEIVTSITW